MIALISSPLTWVVFVVSFLLYLWLRFLCTGERPNIVAGVTLVIVGVALVTSAVSTPYKTFSTPAISAEASSNTQVSSSAAVQTMRVPTGEEMSALRGIPVTRIDTFGCDEHGCMYEQAATFNSQIIDLDYNYYITPIPMDGTFQNHDSCGP